MTMDIEQMIRSGVFAGYSRLAARDIDQGDLDCQTARKAMAGHRDAGWHPGND